MHTAVGRQTNLSCSASDWWYQLRKHFSHETRLFSWHHHMLERAALIIVIMMFLCNKSGLGFKPSELKKITLIDWQTCLQRRNHYGHTVFGKSFLSLIGSVRTRLLVDPVEGLMIPLDHTTRLHAGSRIRLDPTANSIAGSVVPSDRATKTRAGSIQRISWQKVESYPWSHRIPLNKLSFKCALVTGACAAPNNASQWFFK